VGVKTQISVAKLQQLFPSYGFTKLTPTTSGVIDTTYIAYTPTTSYILKYFERDIEQKVAKDALLLKELQRQGLNVPRHLSASQGWHLYTRLKGVSPSRVRAYHLQALAQFLSTMHKERRVSSFGAKRALPIKKELHYVKKHYFSYYKCMLFLKSFRDRDEALIHGDIFKDNTLFEGKKIGVIDFIDSFRGSFAFDVGVALVGFDVKLTDEYSLSLFLNTYNQKRVKKLSKVEAREMMRVASFYYGLKRIYRDNTTYSAKELLV